MPMYRYTLINLGRPEGSQDMEMIDDAAAEVEAFDGMDICEQLRAGNQVKWIELRRLADGS